MLVNKKLSIKILIKGIILFLIPILFFISWKIIVFKNGITDQFDLDRININGLINILFKRIGEDWQIETYNNFINFIFNNKFMGLTTFLWWVLLSVALIITSVVFFKKYGNKIIIVSISMSIGFLLNLFALLCLYFYTFSAYEATNLASVWRYTSPYILGLVFLLSYIWIDGIVLNLKNINFKIAIMTFLVSILYLSIHFANTVDYKPKKIEGDYKIKYKKDFDYMKNLPKDSKILIISNGDDWYNSIRFNYNFLEKKLYFVSNSYGKKIYDDEALNRWTIDIDKNELLQYIKTFDYIYFYNADDNFINNYGDLFKYIPENRSGVHLVNDILK